MPTITQTGPMSWRCQVRIKGHRPLCQTFRSEPEARAWGEAQERAIRAGRQADDGVTVSRAIAAFRELRATRRPVREQSTEHYMLRNIERGLGSVAVARLTPERLTEYCRMRALDAGPYTIGMEVSKLGTVLKFASIQLRMDLPDVVAAARPLLDYAGLIGPGKDRERRPSADELAAIREHLEPLYRDIVDFAIGSAMRRGEICRIRWEDVDEARRLVLVRDRKDPRKTAGNHQWVPLVDAAVIDAWAIVQRQPRTSERIFPVSPESVSDRFLTACRVAGVEDLHFHDLRHEATSRLFEAGWTIERVALVTGHANWVHLKRYTNLRPEMVHSLAAADGGAGGEDVREGEGYRGSAVRKACRD